ncbi:MAG: type II toxin-antitoxin system RelE/ParE family toxin [Acidobacteria bacterium]|nr:type II toxin-antitoxin system RelE/ParE family toxin [Acidobacteriota bacterium]MBI3279410.1 type II toxin-antitoxin system RelE/ParE family toxin [Acidobacteriota bacterium]
MLRAQWRWPAGMPLCRPMGTGLWEIALIFRRSAHRGCCCAFIANIWWRCMGSSRKTRATPDDDLALARKRRKELMR